MVDYNTMVFMYMVYANTGNVMLYFQRFNESHHHNTRMKHHFYCNFKIEIGMTTIKRNESE